MCDLQQSIEPPAWRQFVMDLGNLDAETVEGVLTRHGAQSITYSDAGDAPQLEPAPGETPLWPELRITGLFGGDVDVDAVRDDLMATLAVDVLPPYEITDLAERAWEREWLAHFGPMQFGSRLWVCPGDSAPASADAVVVRLDPGLAFGTGTHATTALCLEWLDGIDLTGKTVLDMGCGSGVLAIAALRLGAAAATAVDIDPQALRATAENAQRNQVADRLEILPADTKIETTFDVVLANILAAPLIDNAAAISAYAGDGCLLALSGILSEQVDAVRLAYAARIAFDEPAFRAQDGQTWARLTGRRHEG